jgi:hypothetical protein
MPNVVSQVSDGKARGWQKVDYLENVERVETVDCVRSQAGEVGEQYVKHSLGFSHHYLRGKP